MKISPIDKIKILSCYNEIDQILKGNLPVPRTVEFFFSNACNHSCLGCHSKILHNSKNKFLNIKRAKELIDELNTLGVKSIEISGGGEPLMHPNIIEFIKYIASKNIKVGLFTNGILIKNEKDLIDNLLFIRIAFDASNKETYKKIHGKDDYTILLENIKKLVSYKKTKNKGATIGLKFLISKINCKEILEAAILAKKLGVDYIQFKIIYNTNYGVKNLKEVKALFKKVKKLSTINFNVIGSVEKSFIKSRCILTPLHPLIDASGDVYLCAFFQHRMNTHKIGSILNRSFKEVFYSDKHRELLKKIKPSECNIFNCPFHEASKVADEIIFKNKMHLEFI